MIWYLLVKIIKPCKSKIESAIVLGSNIDNVGSDEEIYI